MPNGPPNVVRPPKSGHRRAARVWSSRGGGSVVRFSRIRMSSGECPLTALSGMAGRGKTARRIMGPEPRVAMADNRLFDIVQSQRFYCSSKK